MKLCLFLFPVKLRPPYSTTTETTNLILMVNIVLFGPPGAGKGTQAQMLEQKYGFNHISTGEVIRDEIQRGTKRGRMVREEIERGHLAPDGLVLEIIEEHMAEHKDSGNIFDGFPRTTIQAVEFDKILKKHGLQVDVMLSLEVPDEELMTRILLRAEQSSRADDSDLAIIKNRIDVYKAQTAIVADHYTAQDKYVPIDGTGSVDEVFSILCDVIDSVIASQNDCQVSVFQ